jgi:hypothetical protein
MSLQKGSQGEKVRELQQLLNSKGYVVEVDGVFGRNTLNSWVSFHKNNGLLIDGVAGEATMKILESDKRSLKESDYQRAADELGVDIATIKAVESVESAGSGFQKNGRIKILFEGHKFWEELNKVTGNSEIKSTDENADILHQKSTTKFYKQDQWDRLDRAALIHKEAALKSASYGLFQIMGFNYGLCGFPDVESFVNFNKQSDGHQLLCFVRFCTHQGIHVYLQNKDWAKFAYRYNGAGYKKNKYDTKLAAAYKKFS